MSILSLILWTSYRPFSTRIPKTCIPFIFIIPLVLLFLYILSKTRMSTATVFFCIPNLNVSPLPRPRFASPNPFLFHEFHTSILICSPLNRSGFERNRCFDMKPMVEMSRVFALRSGDACEESGTLEAEAILNNGPPEFPRDLADGGLEYTLNKLSKWLVAAIFGAAIVWKHDAEALWIATGSVLNSCLSVTLKKILNQERPVPHLRSDPGMPSSHAQSIFFTVASVALALIQWLGINMLTVTIGALAFVGGSYLSWLRVTRQLHTISQVVVGALLGTFLSIAWFWLWHTVVLKAFVSFLWVRIFVVLGSVGFCLAFLLYVIKYWLREDN